MRSTGTSMIDFPNALYDPVKGHELYNRHLRTMIRAEQLGFDGLAVNEHHSMVYSMTPTVSLMAARLGAVTHRAKIQVAGTPINLQYPNRVSEEYAMLDVMSGGRMEYAFPLGTGMEYWANEGTVNPATARARFREGLDIILRSWSEDGPFRYDGEFYNYRYLNPWPKPFQKPRPEVLHRRDGQRGDGLAGRRLRPRLLGRLRAHPEPAARVRTAARAGRGEGAHDRPGRPDHRRHGVRRRDRRAGGRARRGRTSRSSSAGSTASRRGSSCRPAT